jgi:hypothetical protein
VNEYDDPPPGADNIIRLHPVDGPEFHKVGTTGGYLRRPMASVRPTVQHRRKGLHCC